MFVRIESIIDTRWFDNAERVRVTISQEGKVSGLYNLPGLNKWAVENRIGKDPGNPVLLKREGGIFDGLDIKTPEVAEWLDSLKGSHFKALIAICGPKLMKMKPFRFEEIDGKRATNFVKISAPGKNNKREYLEVEDYLKLPDIIGFHDPNRYTKS